MTDAKTIAVAYFLDWIAGDPDWLPHPVRLMGHCTQLAEPLLRWPGQTPLQEVIAGAALTAGVVGGSYLATAKVIAWEQRNG
jgi:adenosylcobinamide-phosphate synthase